MAVGKWQFNFKGFALGFAEGKTLMNKNILLNSVYSFKKLLEKYNVKPKKSLGQHFLIDRKVLKKIIQVACLSKKDTILEIGPGIGTLTLELSPRVKKVIAIEKDKKMCEILKEVVRNTKNVKVIRGNILKTDPLSLVPCYYKIVANIPYYLTSPVIRMFLESPNPPQEMILMVQKEVAKRICAKVPKMNLLAVCVQFYAKPKIVSYVSKNSFWPKPKVDSAIIKITNIRQFSANFANIFFKVIKAGFSHPRKLLVNNLSEKLKIDKQKIKKVLSEIGLDEKTRAENLSIKDWKRLVKLLNH